MIYRSCLWTRTEVCFSHEPYVQHVRYSSATQRTFFKQQLFQMSLRQSVITILHRKRRGAARRDSARRVEHAASLRRTHNVLDVHKKQANNICFITAVRIVKFLQFAEAKAAEKAECGIWFRCSTSRLGVYMFYG